MSIKVPAHVHTKSVMSPASTRTRETGDDLRGFGEKRHHPEPLGRWGLALQLWPFKVVSGFIMIYIYVYNFSCNSYNSIYSWAPAVDCWILIWGCLNKRYTTKWPSKNRDKYDEAMNVGSQFGSYMNSGF